MNANLARTTDSKHAQRAPDPARDGSEPGAPPITGVVKRLGPEPGSCNAGRQRVRIEAFICTDVEAGLPNSQSARETLHLCDGQNLACLLEGDYPAAYSLPVPSMPSMPSKTTPSSRRLLQWSGPLLSGGHQPELGRADGEANRVSARTV